MSKNLSEVAFIPDNISNISSGKEAFNEDTSQKIEDYSVSKLTKNPNLQPDHYSGFDSASNKNLNEKNQEEKNEENQDLISKQEYGRISFGKNENPFKNDTDLENVKEAIVFSSEEKSAFPSYSLPIENHADEYHELNHNELEEKYTNPDVISEKEFFVVEKEENFINENHENWKNDLEIYQKIRFRVKNSEKAYNEVNETYPETENETFNVVEINKYEEFETEKGWLEHYVIANNKLLYQQTNTLLTLNQASLNEIQKVELRAKIIELEIETNKLKIALRRSPATKHINFSVDFKLNRSPVLKIPKKIDIDLRSYCDELEKKLIEARAQSQEHENSLQILEFYEEEFKKKVNFAYIYQQYLLEKGNKTLLKNYEFYKNESRKSVSKNKNERQVKTKNTLKSKKSLENNQIELSPEESTPSFLKNSELIGDESFTSLANKLDDKKTFKKKKSTKSIDLSKFDVQSSSNYQSPQKDSIKLAHHKSIDQPSNKNLNESELQKLEPALFNSANRSKKYFYYECQKYLRELEKDYLIGCEDEKRKVLLTDERGFRQRELLKMKAQNMKNEILDTQVDVTTKQSELKKENQILLKELELLENEFFLKYGEKNQYSSQTLPTNRELKSPKKSRVCHENDYDLIYRQAEKILKTYKSANLLERISKQNISKSPYKQTAETFFNKLVSSQQKIIIKRTDSEEINTPIKNQTKRLVSHSKKSLSRSSSKENKFINRFKPKLVINKNEKAKLSPKEAVNPEKNIIPQSTKELETKNEEKSKEKSKIIQSEYYIG